jgi:hypothetical protein
MDQSPTGIDEGIIFKQKEAAPKGRLSVHFGQKATCRRKTSCPLYPRKQTCAVQLRMSALGQKRTHAAQQLAPLFDHLDGGCEQRRRYFETKCFGSCHVDDEIEFGRLFDRNIAWLRPAQNLVDILGGTTVLAREV